MAKPKRGQMFQFMVPARSSSDGSLITGMTASDFNSGAVCKWFGVNHGVSDAFTSGTMSKTARLVSSGLMQFTLNATENNYDEMVFRARKTSMRPMFAAWNNQDYDESDLMSRLSDVASDLRSYMVETRSQLSDVQSYLVAVSGSLSDVQSAVAVGNSKLVVNKSDISDIQSYLVAMSGALSDVESQLDLVPTVNNSDAISNVYSLLTLVASNVSDIESQLDLVPTANLSDAVSDILALLSDLDSNFNSRVPKEPAARSQVSDLASDLRSYLVAMSGALSDVESQLDLVPTVNNSDAISNVYSLLTLVASNVSDIESQVDAGVEIGASSLSDIRSAITANGMQTAGADPTAVVGVTATYGAKIDWLTAMSRNKLTQTSTSAVLFNDAGTAVASATVSDDGTTATRDEWH